MRTWISMEPTLAPPAREQSTGFCKSGLHRNKMTRAQHGGQGCHTKKLLKEWSRRQLGSPTQAQPTDTCQCLACFSQFGHGPTLEPSVGLTQHFGPSSLCLYPAILIMPLGPRDLFPALIWLDSSLSLRILLLTAAPEFTKAKLSVLACFPILTH